ncbi:MAG TPA: hypothetical protein VGG72_15720 [Bryobacteraceae bacterium]|jgi:hypothetical protein
MRTLVAFFSLFLTVRAQAPQPSSTQPSVASEWNISKTIAAFSDQAKRLKPILDHLTPQEWVNQGAPQAYLSQWQQAEMELSYVDTSAKSFEQNPERLTLALDTLFRWERLAVDLNSLVDGVRHYQNPAVGDLLVSVLGENSSNRELLKQHITDLAAQKEEEFAVVDKEAQRCRGQVTRPAPPKPAAAKPAAPKQEVKPQ